MTANSDDRRLVVRLAGAAWGWGFDDDRRMAPLDTGDRQAERGTSPNSWQAGRGVSGAKIRDFRTISLDQRIEWWHLSGSRELSVIHGAFDLNRLMALRSPACKLKGCLKGASRVP